MKWIINYKIVTILLLFFCTNTTFCQEPEKKERPNQGFVFRLSEQDVIIPVTSIEWGHPDRWSFTSRYMHHFEKERKRRTWQNGAGIFLSPGLSGVRLGVNYLTIYSPPSPSLREFALFGELRGVLLRTWGNPLSTGPGVTFGGAEFKLCVSWLLGISAGYYSPISNSNEHIKPFWGFHFGIGI